MQTRMDEGFAAGWRIWTRRRTHRTNEKSLDNRSGAELGLPAQCKQLHFRVVFAAFRQ
jgi:hypothetical protein